MSRPIFFLIIASLALSALAGPKSSKKERKLFVGKNATEATLTFTAQVEYTEGALLDYTPNTVFGSPWKSFSKADLDGALKGLAQNQVTYLFGPMSLNAIKAVPKKNHTIEIVEDKKGSLKSPFLNAETHILTYRYKGTFVIENIANSQTKGTYPVILPIRPESIYREATQIGSKKSLACTDSEPDHSTESFFWYFWSPNRPGCQIKEGTNYLKINADYIRNPNSKATYPEYRRLLDSTGTIRIDMLFGIAGDDKNTNPKVSNDENARNYLMVQNKLKQMGFQLIKTWTTQDILKAAPGSKSIPTVQTLEKSTTKLLPNGTKETIKQQIRMFYGATGFGDQDSIAFVNFFSDSLANAGVMMYSGHSSLGQGLNLDSLERFSQMNGHNIKFQPNLKRYQIYYFNGCSTYAYYNKDFFGRKKTATDPSGSNNLDVITNGLATYFYYMGTTDLTLLRAIDLWAQGKPAMSYQSIANEIDSDNLSGINGETDAGNLKPTP